MLSIYKCTMKGYAPCGGNIIYDLLLGDNKI